MPGAMPERVAATEQQRYRHGVKLEARSAVLALLTIIKGAATGQVDKKQSKQTPNPASQSRLIS